jgi:hypothetical protein
MRLAEEAVMLALALAVSVAAFRRRPRGKGAPDLSLATEPETIA